MKSFAMLETFDVDPANRVTRYFIDGVRVSQAEYRKLVDNCARQDVFHSYAFAGRIHCRSVCYR